MPELSTSKTANSDHLFIGLQSYTEAQTNIFYGRSREVDAVTNLVKLNTLTIVFGKSGTGKTSLLNAGVFPRLRKSFCLPFRIRLSFQKDSADLSKQIRNILKEEIDQYGFQVQGYADDSTTLWEYFHREPLWNVITPILIFDQFEEIFTLGKKNEKFTGRSIDNFWQELADLIENSIPSELKDKFLNEKEKIDYAYKSKKAKVVFSFREEFLPEFENLTGKIPSLKHSRYRLMPMDGNQAMEVVTRTWGDKITEPQAAKVVHFFSNDSEQELPLDVMEIEPSLLSQVCSHLDKQRIADHSATISSAFLNKYPKDAILRSIYDEAVLESNQAVVAANPELAGQQPMNVFLEDKLITDEGFRIKYALTGADEKIRPGIQVLENKYFLRDDGKAVELTHDVLTPIIKADRETRRQKAALEAERRRAARKALLIVILALILSAAIWYMIAHKAVSDKNEAIREKDSLDVQIKSAHDTLKGLNDNIALSRIKMKSMSNASRSAVNANGDTASIVINNKDSVQLALLQQQYKALVEQKSFLQQRLDSINALLLSTRNGDRSANEQSARLETWRQMHTDDSSALASLQEKYNVLLSEFNAYKNSHPVENKENAGNAAHEVLSNAISLRLHYTFLKKVPPNLTIYLVPYDKQNLPVIRQASVYEVGCDEEQLTTAKGGKTAIFNDGLYSFNHVAEGKYFIKICGYYGGYGTYEKKGQGNVTIDFAGAPAIR